MGDGLGLQDKDGAHSLLDVRQLSVTLGADKIIDNLSFSVNPAEIITVLGPNGAGKTVLLRSLLGLLPYEGQIIWRGNPKIGYLPQGLNQFAVKDFPLTVHDMFMLKNGSVRPNDLEYYLQLVGLEKAALHKRAANLSGGQFQRMLIAWVLIARPQVILFDEPATGIDVGGGETIYSLLQTIHKKEKITILLVTHDLSIVYKYSTRVLCLSKKGGGCYGPPAEILNTETLQTLFGNSIGAHVHAMQSAKGSLPKVDSDNQKGVRQ